MKARFMLLDVCIGISIHVCASHFFCKTHINCSHRTIVHGRTKAQISQDFGSSCSGILDAPEA